VGRGPPSAHPYAELFWLLAGSALLLVLLWVLSLVDTYRKFQKVRGFEIPVHRPPAYADLPQIMQGLPTIMKELFGELDRSLKQTNGISSEEKYRYIKYTVMRGGKSRPVMTCEPRKSALILHFSVPFEQAKSIKGTIDASSKGILGVGDTEFRLVTPSEMPRVRSLTKMAMKRAVGQEGQTGAG
jgi:predicted transport protein